MNRNAVDVGQNPASLVAILVAAHKAKDRVLEREAKRRLAEVHGVRLTFLAQINAKSNCEVHDA